MVGIRKDCLREYEKLKGLVLDKFPEFNARDLCKILGRLGVYHYKKKGLLIGEERRLYNFLIENSYNPYTTYRWALLERVPEEIKFQLRNHQLSQKRASSLFFQKKHQTETQIQNEIKELGLRLIREM